jgi:hypothetical protein
MLSTEVLLIWYFFPFAPRMMMFTFPWTPLPVLLKFL